MADSKERGCMLLSRTESVDLDAVATTNLYIIPANKIAVWHYNVIRELSADAALTVATFGQTTAKTDFLTAQTLSNLNAAAAAGILMPVPNATTVKLIEYTEGEILCIDVTTAAGAACICTIEVFGTLMDE